VAVTVSFVAVRHLELAKEFPSTFESAATFTGPYDFWGPVPGSLSSHDPTTV
jgi:hypothetical protein